MNLPFAPDLIDTHAHLVSERFTDEVDEIIRRGAAAGVRRVVSISCDLDDSRANLALSERHSGVWAAVGIHPVYVHAPGEDDWVKFLRELAGHPRAVAIGETGLDFYHPPQDGSSVKSWRARQYDAFSAQLQLAQELSLPVVVHQRECAAEVSAVLRDFPGVRAVLHCFSGTLAEAEEVLEMGHMISFTGTVTYPKSVDLREVARSIPLDRIMVETDSPYLPPQPLRGKRNEPAFVTHTAQVLADLHGMSPSEFARATTGNAVAFFRLVED
jgi:TatD DNase family protein